MKYLINDEVVERDEFFRQLQDDMFDELYDDFDDYLDGTFDEVSIGALTFSASQVLKNVDKVAYRCEYNDYLDMRLEDLEYEFDNNETDYNFNNNTYETKEEEE